MLAQLVAVFLGGVLGVSFRIVLDTAFTLQFGDVAYLAVMIINALGSFILAALTAGAWKKTSRFPALRSAIGPGFLGGFTTFSAVMVHAVVTENVFVSALYLGVSLATSLFSALAGLWFGGMFAGKKRRVKR